MYPYDLEINAENADFETWRIERLQRVLGYAQALADIASNDEFYKKIKSLFDNDGELIVEWFVPPTEDEKVFFNSAWNSIVADYETRKVNHI
jgi:hypothetical protein